MKKLHFLIVSLCLFLNFSYAQNYEIHDYKYIVHFDSDQDQLTPHAKLQLEDRLLEYPQSKIISITLIGHTDKKGSNSYNIDLSQRRAETVYQFLKEKGYPNIDINFQGEHQPNIIADNEMAYQQNRRVEILFQIRGKEKEPLLCAGVVHEPEMIETPIIEELSPLQEFYQELDKPAQTFNVNNQEGGAIQGNEGTIIFFDKESFCDCETQEPIQGKMEAQLKEYYEIGDFLRAGLHTNAGEKMLQTGGTINIKVFAEGKEVCLKERMKYNILFPIKNTSKEALDNINLFTGNINDEGELNWGVMRKNSLVNNDALQLNSDNFRTRRDGDVSIDCNRSKRGFFYRVRKFIFFHQSWKGYKYSLSKKGQEECKKRQAEAAKKAREYQEKRDAIIEKFGDDYPALVKALKKEGMGSIPKNYLFSHYITESTTLNWINCDRFLKMPSNERQIVSIPFNKKGDITARLIIKEYNSIIQDLKPKSNHFYFGQMPKKATVHLMIIDYSGKAPKMAQHTFNVGDTVSKNQIVFQEYTIKEMKDEFQKLN